MLHGLAPIYCLRMFMALTITPISGSSPNYWLKVGSTQLSTMSQYAVALQVPFSGTTGPQHVPAS